MPKRVTAGRMLDGEFLTIRARLIDIAAALDRIDRCPGMEEARADPRWAKLMDGAAVLADGKADRAERIQLLFSDSYDDGWRRTQPSRSPHHQ